MIRKIVSQYGETSVFANQFFIPWASVATLAYTGFSRTLLSIKQKIEEEIPGLTPENPGSKWPKTSLGCLREHVKLSDNQVRKLRKICEQKSIELKKIEKSDQILKVIELHFVTFHCRTLERRLISQPMRLEGVRFINDQSPQQHLMNVSNLMAAFCEEQHEQYYPGLAPKGRTIDTYYRAPHVESTLVYDIKPSTSLIEIIENFKIAVDIELPDCYEWFDPQSWHMTVRALMATTEL